MSDPFDSWASNHINKDWEYLEVQNPGNGCMPPFGYTPDGSEARKKRFSDFSNLKEACRGMCALVVTTVLTIGVDFPQDLKVATQEERPHAMQQHTPRVTT